MPRAPVRYLTLKNRLQARLNSIKGNSMATRGKRGGKRPGAGRKRGTRNRATIEQQATLCELARQRTAVAIAALERIARKGKSEAAVVSAATALLDRGYGRPAQTMELAGPGGGPIRTMDMAQLAKLDDKELAFLERIAAKLAGSGSGANSG
jgi:hypothetical protein